MRAPPGAGQVNALESRFYAALERAGLSGFERQPSDVAGRPDAYFRHVRPQPIAIFLDGCFWHGCPVHFRPSVTGGAHRQTREGAMRQRLTDSRIRRALTAAGTRVLAWWEHDLIDADRRAREVAAAVKGAA